MKRVWVCAAVLAVWLTPHIAISDVQRYLPDPDLCDAHIGTLKTLNPFVLTSSGFGNLQFACEWTDGEMIYVSGAKITALASCSNTLMVWKKSYLVGSPGEGIVSLRPANTDMNATLFYACSDAV